ncbi:hypothetical protein [Actinomadura rayongensis]|uniref:Uncharacterized protein n=1 Tax=Actinomadura rayongensis TaxID=1429076 RepID=A0A6I4W4V1_9ACTN|nr:hypothetical protein [Actinomadura rayongensis]MXQ64488.1 hypothetical protein [Actinomadura rayongensis]
MDLSLRRLVLSGSLVLAPALGLTPLLASSAEARAGVNLDAIAEDIIESGYYVDAHARYLRTDRAQELLRSAQARVVPVFVAVVPAGNDPDAIIAALPGKLERKGTYAVLAGNKLRVKSDTLPAAQVNGAYARSLKAYPGKPDRALVAFIRTLPVSKYAPPAPGKPGNNGKPAPEAGTKRTTLAESQPTAPASGYRPADRDGGGVPLYAIGGGVAVVLAGGGAAFLLARRRRAASRTAAPQPTTVPAAQDGPPPTPPADGAPNTPPPPVPAPGPDTPAAPGPDAR